MPLRSGMVLRPDIFIGALIGALTAITAAAPLTLLRALPRRTVAPLIRTTCGVLLGLTLSGIVYGVVGVGRGGGYSQERPKRLFVQQVLRIDHDVGGAELAREGTLWLNAMDINGLDPLIPHVTSPRTPSHGVTAMRRAPAFQHQAPRALHLGSFPSPTSFSGRGLCRRHEFSKVAYDDFCKVNIPGL